MKKILVSVLAALVLLCTFILPSFAKTGEVSFEDGKIIAFAPGSVYSDTDLFGLYKGVMPGDRITQNITIINKAKDCDYIKVYMRAVPSELTTEVLKELSEDERRQAQTENEYMLSFLNALKLTVKNGENIIFDDFAGNKGGLSENVLISELKTGESRQLEAELYVPIELGNEYADRTGQIDWVFTVEAFTENVPPVQNETLLTVRKIWEDDGQGRPEKITVNLLKDGKTEKTAELTAENQWTYTFDKLDKKFNWTAEEAEVPEGYKVSYETENNVVTIVNTKESEPPVPPAPIEKTSLTVIKKWDDEGKDRPDSVKVTLYNGKTAYETVTLSSGNNWTYTWKELDGAGNWQIVETGIPKGYTPSYEYNNKTVTVTNTETLIHTGQENLPVIIFGAAGIIMLVSGIIIIKGKRKQTDA